MKQKQNYRNGPTPCTVGTRAEALAPKALHGPPNADPPSTLNTAGLSEINTDLSDNDNLPENDPEEIGSFTLKHRISLIKKASHHLWSTQPRVPQYSQSSTRK